MDISKQTQGTTDAHGIERKAPMVLTDPTDDLPKFKDLPLDPSHPPHSAWFLWGKDDQLGCLNHLTPERVVAAAKEIQTGTSVGLNWEMHQMSSPPPYRSTLKHEIFSIGGQFLDDRVEFNTQTSSQWDSFRHCAYPDGRLYNGVMQNEVRTTPVSKDSRNGIHEWAKKGIVGRGILIDFYAYAEENGIEYDAWSYYEITVQQIKEIAQVRGITFKAGDILYLRTGFTQKYESLPEEEVAERMGQSQYFYPGLHGSLESLEWLWDSRFAAVASDCPGFEAWGPGHMTMHEYILAGFGMPIGELFDLEDLAEQCKKHNRWTFFVSSEPLNVIGGVGSPPNAVAVF
ncbi:hypothetical protein H2203_008071 [Taxawa tesnikishii (nom. ined.)]|nr:hypothetical protein H2203_008071 [Dothideales sp. JES 119]